MIRVILFLVALAILATGAAWIADRPGDIAVVWQGYRIETSVAVGLVAVLLFALLLMAIWALARFVFHIPDFMTVAARSRRRSKGFAALSRGMVAVGAGDPASAQRHAADAERLLGREPLTLLLKAQAAQIGGDRSGAEAAFRTMLDSSETRVLGLRGLYVEAKRKGDDVAARAHASKAAELAPSVGWANEAVLEYLSAERNWQGALNTLERRAALRLIDKETARRQRAVLLTADAMDHAEKDTEEALDRAQQAVKLAPDLVPAAALAGRLLSRQGALRKGAKLLEASWKIGPHPDLAAAYIDLRSGDSALDRLERAQTLIRLTPGHPEARLVVARTALDAREFAAARQALAPLLHDRPTVRVCLLMAEIEEEEHGAKGAVREWLGRASRAPRDAAWIADGIVSDHWEPVSPVSGRLDAYVWATPTELLSHHVDVDHADHALGDGNEDAVPVYRLPHSQVGGEEADISKDGGRAVSGLAGDIEPELPVSRAPRPEPTATETSPIGSGTTEGRAVGRNLAGSGAPEAASTNATVASPTPSGRDAQAPAAMKAGNGTASPTPDAKAADSDDRPSAPAGQAPATGSAGATVVQADIRTGSSAAEGRGVASSPQEPRTPAATAADTATSLQQQPRNTAEPAVRTGAIAPVIFPIPRPPDDPGPDLDPVAARPRLMS